MNPKPFSSLNHLTVPVGISARHRTSRRRSVQRTKGASLRVSG
jgi:hypothetical protein